MIYAKRPAKFKPKFEVVGCFLEYQGKILLLQRKKDKFQGQRWGLPAGKKESNETTLEALVREVKEETGNTIKPKFVMFCKSIYVNHFHDFIFHIYRYKLESPLDIEINLLEHSDYQWVTPKEALKLNLIDDMEQCIEIVYGKR